MGLRFERNEDGTKYRKLDNMFWRDLREFLRKKNGNVSLAPALGTALLSPVEQRSLKIVARVDQLINSGADPNEARRLAFIEVYPPLNTE